MLRTIAVLTAATVLTGCGGSNDESEDKLQRIISAGVLELAVTEPTTCMLYDVMPHDVISAFADGALSVLPPPGAEPLDRGVVIVMTRQAFEDACFPTY